MQMMHFAPCVLTRDAIPVAQRTMEDDPLRALRAVRFGARFRFQVAEDLAASLRSKDTHAVLASKVSIQPDPSGPGAQPHWKPRTRKASAHLLGADFGGYE